MKFGIIGVGVLVFVAAVAYRALRDSNAAASSAHVASDSQGSQPADLEIIRHQPTNVNFFKYVTGTVRNNTTKPYEYVKIEIAIYSNGQVMGTTSASIKDLPPGGTGDFEAPVLEQGEFKYEFTRLTGR